MACVALASLISTIQLEFLQPFPRVPLLHQPSIQSFFESICSLQAFLQESSGGAAAIKDLEIQIRDFALKAEDDIEIQLSNFVLAKGIEDQEKASQQLHLALQEAAENASELLNIIDNTSNNVAGDDDNEAQPPLHWLKPASESQNGKSNGSSPKLVGSHSRNSCGKIIFELWFCGILKIISIVGMVGVGKTTLAKSVYLDPEVGKRFDVQGWITMPQQYNKNQLLDLLRLLLQSLSPAAEKKIEMGSFAPEEVQVQAFLEKESSGGDAALKYFETIIRDFALKVEDDIEIQVSNFVVAKAKDDAVHQEAAFLQLCQILQQAQEKTADVVGIIIKGENYTIQRLFDNRTLLIRHIEKLSLREFCLHRSKFRAGSGIETGIPYLVGNDMKIQVSSFVLAKDTVHEEEAFQELCQTLHQVTENAAQLLSTIHNTSRSNEAVDDDDIDTQSVWAE